MKSVMRLTFAVAISLSGLVLSPVVPGGSTAAHANWIEYRGEILCRDLRKSGGSGWQGKFSGLASGSGWHQEANEWRCFDSRKNCASWLTQIRSQYGSRVYVSRCDPFTR